MKVLEPESEYDPSAFVVAVVRAAAVEQLRIGRGRHARRVGRRLLLEHGYEALHGAALTRATLLGSATAVFVGIASNDYANAVRASSARSVYGATGASHSIASGRLSYVLGLHGPCVSCDTACSAALVALRLSLIHI